MFSALRNWLQARHAPRPENAVAVECDDQGFRLLTQVEQAQQVQAIQWSEVRRVCFRDMGMMHSDLLLIEVVGSSAPVIVPIEARGGDALWNTLLARGLFPDDLATKAIRSTDGGVYCWPPADAHDDRHSEGEAGVPRG